MSDNELTISDYYEAYPIMRYILPGLVYNNGAAPQKNISNNAFILRQGAWILSKILDDEHTVYGYETFHPAQRYVLGDVSNNVTIDQNKFNTMMFKLNSIATSIRGIGNTIVAGGVNLNALTNANLQFGLGNAYDANPGGGRTHPDGVRIVACSINYNQARRPNRVGHNNNAQVLINYINACHAIINNHIILDNNLYDDLNIMLRTWMDRVLFPLHIMNNFNHNPGAGGVYNQVQINQIINGIFNTVSLLKLLNTLLSINKYDLPFYFIKMFIDRIIDSLGLVTVANANIDGNTIIQIIEEIILSPRFIHHIANLINRGTDNNNINYRKNNFFNHLTDATAPHLNTAIGLHVPIGNPAGSFIVPYTDYEERSESTGTDVIDNRDLINGVHAGAEPRLAQVGDRIRNGRKGDHIATVLTTDDVRLLAIFLQLAVDNFNAPAAKTLYNSRNDINYRDHTNTKGLRNPGIIGSYFDHLIALRETDNTIRKGSGLNQGKVEALSILAGLKYAIQGPIFPVLSQTVFHLVAHYFVRLVLHDARIEHTGTGNMNFSNIHIYDTLTVRFMRFFNGNQIQLQLLQTLDDQVSMTNNPPIFGCPGTFQGHNGQNQPIGQPVAPGQYDHDTQVIKFTRLIQYLLGPGSMNPLTVSTAHETTGPRGRNNRFPVLDSMDAIYDIIKKVHDDIRTFVTGAVFNYTSLENNYAAGNFETVFHGFAGTLAFIGHQELSSINVSTIEPTLFDTDIRHLLKFNVADRAIKVLGNEVHIMGTSTQNSFTGALVGPKQKLSNGSQFIVNDYGVLEYQEIINGQVVQTDNAQLYNKMIGNNDYCKVFGSARFDDPARDKRNVCNTMISACSIIGNYGNPAKCAAAFRDIQDDHISKNLRGWNSLNKELTQLNAYKILTGIGLNHLTNKDGDITFKDDNNDYIFDDQQIFDKLELSKGVAVPLGSPPNVPNVNTSNHVKYVKKLMDTVGIIKITKKQQKKNKHDIPNLVLRPFIPMVQKAIVKLGMHRFLPHQIGGDKLDNPLNIMYGGNSYDLETIRKNIENMKNEAKKRGIVFQRKDELKLDQIMKNLGKYQDELRDIDTYYRASIALQDQNGRIPLKSELEKKIEELKKNINKEYNKIDQAKQVISNAYLISIMN
jgi:hypothetical protein